MSGVTLGSSAIAVPVIRHNRTNATNLGVIVVSFLRLVDTGSGSPLCAADQSPHPDLPDPRLAQRHCFGPSTASRSIISRPRHTGCAPAPQPESANASPALDAHLVK